MKQKTKRQINIKYYLQTISLCITILGILTGCKSDTVPEERGFAAKETAEFKSSFSLPEIESTQLSQPGNYIVNGVELCDPLIASEMIDDPWMGYSEMELGLLSPEEMPNCESSEYGYHTVMYNGGMYMYVNEFNEVMNDPIFQEYADVWATMTPEREVIILGGLEEYGKYSAEIGGNAK